VNQGTASFGEHLRRLRSAASLSQGELAERAGVSVRGISDLERGARQAPRLETVRLLADALGLSDHDREALLAAARPQIVRKPSSARELGTPLSLPTPLTRLIGRTTEVAALQTLFADEERRLVTVTGVGGTGKTRLAIAVAAGLVASYPDGVHFVDLSPLTDPDQVVPSIAVALGVHEVAGQSLRESLAGFLAGKRVLLVLDSCEQVLAATQGMAVLLAGSPDLAILATSREPLHIRGERVFPLLPLPLPPEQLLPLGDLAQVPAIALFLERAGGVQPDFALTEHNAAAIAAICRRLDGLPLAIELAAVRVNVLPPAALLARLEHRLTLLAGGRDLPARQRTMRDVIAWSYDLLSPDAQGLFRRLAVFTGGFALDAAEAVVDPDMSISILDGIVALVEQSLLRQVPGVADEPRYLMLETVREFGLERLGIASEADDARQRHAEHFLRLAAAFLFGSPILMNVESLARIIADQDNIRLALAWFDERGESEALLRLSVMLDALWFARGLYSEGLQWAERALARSRQAATPARIQVLDGAAMLAILQGDYARAETFLNESLELARELGDPFLVGEALAYTGYLAYRQGDYGQADRLLDEGLRSLRHVAHSGHGAFAFLIRGDTALVQEHFDRAALSYQEAIDRFQAAGYAWGLSDAQAGLAGVNFCTGDLARAASHYLASLERAWELGFPMYVASALLGLSAVAATSQQAEVGAHLLGAAEEMIASLGAPMFPRDQPIRERGVAVLHSVLGDERLAAMREAGRSMSIPQAVAEAGAVAHAMVPPGTSEHD
jgi:predicted ATPase/transcriptional regulator with XRE-family HTH domain